LALGHEVAQGSFFWPKRDPYFHPDTAREWNGSDGMELTRKEKDSAIANAVTGRWSRHLRFRISSKERKAGSGYVRFVTSKRSDGVISQKPLSVNNDLIGLAVVRVLASVESVQGK
jgi:hypothetical protein